MHINFVILLVHFLHQTDCGNLNVWFYSCIGVDFERNLIPYFITHYIQKGISTSKFKIILHSIEKDSQNLKWAEKFMNHLQIKYI